MTIAGESTEGTVAERYLSPRARTRFAAEGAVLGLVVGIVGAVVAVGLGFAPVAALGVVPVAVGFVYGRLTWRSWTWAVSDRALELRHGVVVRRASYVPLHRIQQIDVHRGPVDRALGLAELVVRTAAATTDAKLPGLDLDEAGRLRTHLLSRAGVDDAV